MIPVGNTYTARVRGWVWRAVHCEHCGCEFAYRYVATGSTIGFSPLFLNNEGASNAASSRADMDLRTRLNQEVGVVFCPQCGWYQKNMVAKLHQPYLEALFGIALAPIVAGATALLMSVSLFFAITPFLVLLAASLLGDSYLAAKEFGKVMVYAIVALLAFGGSLFLGKMGLVAALVIGGLVVLFCLYRGLLFNPNADPEKRKRMGKNKYLAVLRAEFEKAVEQAQAQGAKNVPTLAWPEK